MQYSLSTISAFAAALSLTSAAPVASSTSQDVVIVRQLAGFDAASTINAKLDATTVNDRKVKSATVSSAGPWCAGFTDSQATQPAKALNGDGIFDSANEAIYTNDVNDAVEIGSWWCAATRPEVEAFVKKALASGDAATPAAPPAEPVNNGGNAAAVTVRVQIQQDAAATTFTQEELPANVGVVAASTIRGLSPAADITIVSSGSGDCNFIDANGLAIDFAAVDGVVDIAAFVCEA
jgi:hypothetical protein